MCYCHPVLLCLVGILECCGCLTSQWTLCSTPNSFLPSARLLTMNQVHLTTTWTSLSHMMTLCDSCRIYHLVQYIAVLYNLICTLMRIFKYAAYVSLQVCVDRMVIVGRAMQRHKQPFQPWWSWRLANLCIYCMTTTNNTCVVVTVNHIKGRQSTSSWCCRTAHHVDILTNTLTWLLKL